MDKAHNDLSAATAKFCLALEEYRRTPDGRVRSAEEFVGAFFPHDDKTSDDRIFKYIPNEVRGPIIAAWGVRGIKAALRDNDEKVQGVIHDALVAGDIDPTTFEDGLAAETIVQWVPLSEVWSFWRGGKLEREAIGKALTVAFELSMFDARWFLDHLGSRTSDSKGTDVLAEGLSKEDLVDWIHAIHETGDGSAKGLVAALGWEKIVSKTASSALVALLDEMAEKAGLVRSDAGSRSGDRAAPGSADRRSHAEAMPFEDVQGTTGIGSQSDEAAESNGLPFMTEEGINIVLEEELIVADDSAPSRPQERERSRSSGKGKS